MATHYELVAHVRYNDEGIEISGSTTWRIHKNGVELPSVYTNRQEAVEAYDGYLNTIEFPDDF
jgi:hypothetical protein